MILVSADSAPQQSSMDPARYARLEAFVTKVREMAAVGTPSITKTAVRAALAELDGDQG